MQAFEYARPSTKEDAVRLLEEAAGGGVILAGGTDLLSLMKDDVVQAKRVVSIKAIEELGGVHYDRQSGLRVGALASLDELRDSPALGEEYPSLRQAIDGIRSPQLQAMGTVGGELCQRPRCWYYRSGFGLLALHGGKSMVVDGDNRYHAILGNDGPAYFVSPSSLAPALVALGARVRIFGGNGEREFPLADFYRIPKREDEREYDLAGDEILTQILVPPASTLRTATYEVRHKEALDWPLATASVAMEVQGNTARSARIVLGHVAPTPWPAPEAAQALSGKALTPEAAEEAGRAAVAGAKPLSRNAYKVQLARVAVKRAILRAAGTEV